MSLLKSLTQWFDPKQLTSRYIFWGGDGGDGSGDGADGADGVGAGSSSGSAAGVASGGAVGSGSAGADGGGSAGGGSAGAGDGGMNIDYKPDYGTSAAQAAASQQPNAQQAGSQATSGNAPSGYANTSAGLVAQPQNVGPAPQAAPLSSYDPYSPYRAQAAGQLNNLVNNPSTALASPGYQAQLTAGMGAADASAAARGQLQSGNELAALNTLGQNTFSSYYNNMFSQLSSLSGANQSPATAASAQDAAQLSSYLAPYQAASAAASAGATTTGANVAGYLAPYTAGQTYANTGLIGANTNLAGANVGLTQAQTAFEQGAKTDLTEAEAKAAGTQASSGQISAIGGLFSGATSAVSGLGGIVGGITKLFTGGLV